MRRIPKMVFKPLPREDNIELVLKMTNYLEDNILDLKNKMIVRFLDLYNIFNKDNKEELIREYIGRCYDEELPELPKKLKKIRIRWNKGNDVFMDHISAYLYHSWPEDVKEITCYVGLLPASVRNLENFTLYIDMNLDIDVAMHEIADQCCQFIYYDKWKKMFPTTTKEDFEYPSLIWKLSKMATDPILNCNVVNKTFGNYECNHKTYDYFYNEENKHVIKYIKEIYLRDDIDLSIPNSYEYVKKEWADNEKET